MNWKDLDFRPSNRKLRQFAAIWLLLFAALATWGALQARSPWLLVCLALSFRYGRPFAERDEPVPVAPARHPA